MKRWFPLIRGGHTLKRPRSVAFAAALLLAPGLGAHAQDGRQSVHWAYAAFFGTGRYTLDGGAETTMLSFAPGRLFRESELSGTGERRAGYRLRVPLSIGAHELDAPESLPDLRFHSVTSLSIVPGVEIDLPISTLWSLKPLAYAGWGTDFGGDASALIFRAGLRSERRFDLDAFDLTLYNGLTRIGYSESDGASSGINLFEAGLDFGRLLPAKKMGDEPVRLYWHILYTRYFDELSLDAIGLLDEASSRLVEASSVGSEWELGAGFGKAGSRLGIWRLKFDRVGISYRFDSDGQFSGIGIVFKSLFAR